MTHPLLIPEILFLILSCSSLSKHELALCRQVCHRWYDIAQLCLWQQLELDQEGASQNHGLFSSRKRRKAFINQLALKGHLVRTLVIPDCRSDISFLREMIRRMPMLETIVVNRVALNHYQSVLSQLVDETDGNSDNCQLSQPQHPPPVVSTLRSLHLPRVTEDNRGTEMLLQLCKRNPGLRHIELVDSELDDDVLGEMARYCSDLTSLDLSRSENLRLGDEFTASLLTSQKEGSKDDGKGYSGQHAIQIMTSSLTPSQQGRRHQGQIIDPINYHLHSQQQQHHCLREQEYSQEYSHPCPSSLWTQMVQKRDMSNEQAARKQGDLRGCSSCTGCVRGESSALQQQYHQFVGVSEEKEYIRVGDRRHGHQQQTNATHNNETSLTETSCSLLDHTTTTTPNCHWCCACRQGCHTQDSTIVSNPEPPKTVFPSYLSRYRLKPPPQRPMLSRLEHLSLVFCLGITNTGFQRFFDSLYGYALRSVNLEFTLIQDSGLKTLAQACGGSGFSNDYHHQQGHEPANVTQANSIPNQRFSSRPSSSTAGLRSVIVNYCSKITHEGIRALTDNCPNLESLEFVGCDAVSAQVFDRTRPWRCTGLKRLAFTLQPSVAMNGSNSSIDGSNAATSTPHVSAYPTASLETTVPEGLSATMPSVTGTSSDSPSPANPFLHGQKQTSSDERDVRAAQEEEQRCKAIVHDYHTMFWQLKRLTRLESLHMYNSPLINAHLPCVDEDVEVATTEIVQAPHSHSRRSREVAKQQRRSQRHDTTLQESKQQKQPIYHHELPPKDKHLAIMKSSNATGGASFVNDPGEGSSRRVSLENSIRSSPSSWCTHFDEENTLADALLLDAFMSEETRASTSTIESSDDRDEQQQQEVNQKQHPSLNAALHPFAFHAGLKALCHLRQLHDLTLYERATVVLGNPELMWMGRTFPCLRKVKLKGAIHPHGDAVQALALSRPRLDIQVCRLFEEQCL